MGSMLDLIGRDVGSVGVGALVCEGIVVVVTTSSFMYSALSF